MSMKFALAALASMGSMMLATGPSLANDATVGQSATIASSSVPGVTATYESGFEATQGRGRGGFRGGRGGGGFAVRGGRRNNFGRNVAIGTGALILGGIIASQAAGAGGGNSCGRWNYRCNNGDGYACRQLNRYC